MNTVELMLTRHLAELGGIAKDKATAADAITTLARHHRELAILAIALQAQLDAAAKAAGGE